MTYAISYNRPKLANTLAKNANIILKTATLTGANYRIPVVLDNFVQDSVALTGLTWALDGDIITAVGAENIAKLANVKPGDVFVGQGGTTVDQPAGTYVVSKTATTLTLSQQMDTASTTYGATATATIQSKTLDATLYILEFSHDIAGTNLRVSVRLYTMDGTKVYDSDNSGDYDAVTVSDGTLLNLGSAIINLDTFYTNARQARVNS